MYKNCIITQQKDQSFRLRDWILYHYNEGFDTFIIFDDKSEDNSVYVLQKLAQTYNININIQITDDEGPIHNQANTKNSNTYHFDGDFHRRIVRSFNRGLNIVKKHNPDAICSFTDVDEFLVTDERTNVVDVIKSQFKLLNTSHIYINSFDVNDDFILDGRWYTLEDTTKMRWDFASMKASSMWNTRGKSICYANLLNNILPLPARIHYLTETLTYKFVKPEILRIHHFRKPSYCNDILRVEDDNLFCKMQKLKKRLNLPIY